MQTVADVRRQLLKAGQEYEAILEALKNQQKEHTRLQTAIGVRESHANTDAQRIISLPELPPLKEQEKRIADHLVAMAANLIDRPYRVAPYIDKNTLVSLLAIKERQQKFSPEKLANELAETYLGDSGRSRAARRAAVALKQHLGRFMQEGTTPYIDKIQKVKVGNSWHMDAITSLRLADWLINLTAVLEGRELNGLLADIDATLNAIEIEGYLEVGPGSLMSDGDHQIYLSTKAKRLMVHLSTPLVESIGSFLSENLGASRDGSQDQWFRAAC